MTDLDEAAAKEGGTDAYGNTAVGNKASAFLRGPDEPAEAYARRIFDRIFGKDIVKVLSMEVLPYKYLARSLASAANCA